MLNKTVRMIQSIRRLFYFFGCLISFSRWFLVFTFVIGLWSILVPSGVFQGFLLGAVILAICAVLDGLPVYQKLSISDLRLNLDMEEKSPLSSNSQESSEWSVIRDNLRNGRNRLLRQTSTLAIPIILNLAMITPTQSIMGSFLKSTRDILANFNQQTTLTILDGNLPTSTTTQYTLNNDSIQQIELLIPNLIRLDSYNQTTKTPPIVMLFEQSDSSETTQPYQSFQMSPEESGTSEDNLTSFSINFALTKNIHLRIPSIAGNQDLAVIMVHKPPIPVVTLAIAGEIKDPWPDDKELRLAISVSAKNPIKLVRLLIYSGGRKARELVNTVTSDDLKEYTTIYPLLLEPYIDQDLATVEIIAEVLDNTLPTPLIGHSRPLHIQIASAYGRYRQTLNTLYKLKNEIDRSIESEKDSSNETKLKLIEQAVKQAGDTPFFDGLDRLEVSNIQKMITDQQDRELTYQTSQHLNRFLEEHEILDDRERDRDFFVAMRGLARFLEQPHNKRQLDTKTVTGRIKVFVKERQKRWSSRIQHIKDKKDIPSWAKINAEKPFEISLDRIQKYDQEVQSSNAQREMANNQKALTELSKSAASFRSWIEELEAAEDKARKQRDQERQKGLANARNQLKEIQKMQNSISSALDRSDSRDQGELNDTWPAVRMKENSNIKSVGRLERQMRNFAPGAAQRLNAALQAMNLTKQNGDEGKYSQAESFSDLASRLLRQAQKKSSGQKQQRQRRRRRRVTGDQYYGQAVHGGDVEINREYQVDKRYREDILEEVQHSDSNEINRSILDHYLRRILR